MVARAVPRCPPPYTENEELNLVDLGVAAMGSGLVGSFVVTPVERIKVSVPCGHEA